MYFFIKLTWEFNCSAISPVCFLRFLSSSNTNDNALVGVVEGAASSAAFAFDELCTGASPLGFLTPLPSENFDLLLKNKP